jgi:clorobiocin biosynthesis protein CloN6
MEYDSIDMVMRGYDTHLPMIQLLGALKSGEDREFIPNLVWKSGDGTIHRNEFSYTPKTYSCGIDWERQPQQLDTQSLPILELLSTQNAGCAYNCPWCGGSRDAFKRINGTRHAMARKPREEIRNELKTIENMPRADQYHFYSVGSYNEPRSGMLHFLDTIEKSRLRSISYEQYHLTPEDILKRMVQANEHTNITLSPESHDIHVSKLAGRGVYTNDELEAWIEKALEIGVYNIDIWYFTGMPEQDEASVMGSVEYAQRLLEKFKGKNVNPMLCPMIPFLDPASTFFEFPDKHGYRVFHRTVEEHRRAMGRASIINRLNYETKWQSRSELVYTGFRAVRKLMEIKAEIGKLPPSWVKKYNARIDDALEFVPIVHEADSIADPAVRKSELDKLGDGILERNDAIFFSGVANQAMPAARQIGGRWFDETGFDAHELAAMSGAQTSVV